MTDTAATVAIPNFIKGNDILVPIKCDVTFGGARFVDSFCWNLYNSMMTPSEFAARTCADLNLPSGFQYRIAVQISEQIAAFTELVRALNLYFENPSTIGKLADPQVINVGIRHNSLEFSDKFWWNLIDSDLTPEEFSRITCSDLGLPGDMEPVISHKIRETLFRLICSWIEDPAASNQKELASVSEIKLYMAAQYSTIDMITNLWKRAKPNSADDIASVAQPTLPQEKDTNASIWSRK